MEFEGKKISPPVTGHQDPRFWELAPEVFEAFCLDFIRAQPETKVADLHGTRGQADHAVDIVASRNDGGVDIFQCKCYQKYTSSHLATHVSEFIKNLEFWKSRGNLCRYVLIIACSISDSGMEAGIRDAVRDISGNGIKFEIWSAGTIRHKLSLCQNSVCRNIATRYFHQSWVSIICNMTAVSSLTRMVHRAFLSLRQMPGKLQEAVNLGASTYSFDESRRAIEELFVELKSRRMKKTLMKVHEFEDIYNGYIGIINGALSEKNTLDDVNSYHSAMISWFEKNIVEDDDILAQ